jgi:carbamoyl-phosphate synthase large subunit
MINDIKKVLVIGSGPIVIGQAAEFDYSGTQAITALKEKGLEVILINSNPATIMTDRNLADRVYMEALTVENIAKIIFKEKPDGLLPTLGGQTGLNLAVQLEREGILKKANVKLLGTPFGCIDRAEDRKLFKELLEELDIEIIESDIVNTLEEAMLFTKKVEYPIIIRPAFTLGGSGGGIAYSEQEYKEIVPNALKNSPINQAIVERSLLGLKEIEYEIIRDKNDTCISVCNMENFDAVGVHTGDSIVVAPSQTLSDKEYQLLRDTSFRIVSALKIEGGCNVQFALDPNSFKFYVIEVNPRVSRSSALASKATGFPIAKVSTLVSLGYCLDEIKNPITGTTYASFEPSLDYIVAKIPRFPFDKFSEAKATLGTQMMATGEVMALGRNFETALLKAVRGLELGVDYLKLEHNLDLEAAIKENDHLRIFYIADAIREGMKTTLINEWTGIDLWFLEKIQNIINIENELKNNCTNELMIKAKQFGFTTKLIAQFSKTEIESVQMVLKELPPSYKMVDTCAGEFEAQTPYFYSSFGESNEAIASDRKKVIILGSGPIRIGQGIEFDYATVHCIEEIRSKGIEAVVINNNPETISTDFNISDRLYFEPLCLEDVVDIIENEQKNGELLGVIVQFGGQTAINLTKGLVESGVTILGSSLETIDLSEDRQQFDNILEELQIARPKGIAVRDYEHACQFALEIGYPVLVRPSFVLGGRAMEIAYREEDLEEFFIEALKVSNGREVYIDQYILGKEVEVDACCDGKDVLISGIMEHIEKAGVHSGDSMCVYPPQDLTEYSKKNIIAAVNKITLRLNILGVVNFQFVLKDDEPYVIEVNPRASRTIPFISKLTSVDMAKVGTRVILGESLKSQGFTENILPEPDFVGVKVPVFSFAKLKNVDVSLGPEMKSTGEAIGIDRNFDKALLKGFEASGIKLKSYGQVLFTIADKHKDQIVPVARTFSDYGFEIFATKGTRDFFEKAGIRSTLISKVDRGDSEDILSYMNDNRFDFIFNTLDSKKNSYSDGFKIRRMAVERKIACLTCIDTAVAFAKAFANNNMKPMPLTSNI